jgi:alkylhydroperoxidase family enzyme
MTDPQNTSQFSAAELERRQESIVARPSRLSALPAEARSKRQQELFDEMSTVVVDGVRKRRESMAALEILIRHAELYKAHMEVAQKYLTDCELDIRDRELAILRIGWLSRAPYEWGSHVKIAKRNGVTTEEIKWVIEGSSASGWNKHERAVIRAMEELHSDSMISDHTWADLQEFCSDKKLIELLILAGQYKTIAYYQNSLRVPLPAGNVGLLAR